MEWAPMTLALPGHYNGQPCLVGESLALLTLGFVGQEVVNLGSGSVVGTDLEALVGHVQDH